MRDLSSTMFYKAKFNIKLNKHDVETDLLWKLVLRIRYWITCKLNRHGQIIVPPELTKWTYFKSGCKLYDVDSQNRFFAESAYHVCSSTPEQISWACRIVEKPCPEPGYAPREWTTEIGYQSCSKNEAEISYVVTYSDAPGFIGSCLDIPSISVPNIIRYLLSSEDLTCTIGNSILNIHPQRLCSGDFPTFKHLICDSKREAPIIYISPKQYSSDPNDIRLLIDPQRASDTVAGNALVFYSEDLNFSKEMCSPDNSFYSCNGGSVRIYFPHIDTTEPSDYCRHRFILAQDILENGEDYILHILRRALAQDVHFYDSMFRLDTCRALLAADEYNKKIQDIRQQSKGNDDAAMELLLNETQKYEDAQAEIQQLTDRIESQKRDIYGFSTQLEHYQKIASNYNNMESACKNIRSIKNLPDTPIAIAQYFAAVYPDRIAFTENCYRSLKDCITKPDILWNIFYHMATDLFDLIHGNHATAYKDFERITGLKCARGEGTMTRKSAKLMRQYTDTYNGHEIDIEPHVGDGNKDSDPRSVRIHFAYDPDVADQILIGHCGKHLDNYTTQKIK